MLVGCGNYKQMPLYVVHSSPEKKLLESQKEIVSD
jgi:hypothetical protein